MLKLAEMEYNGANSIFLRLLLDKKYALPFRVLDALVAHFLSFRNEKRVLPVLWHQSLLTLAQRYKADLASEQKTALQELLKLQTHPHISAEIRRELQNSESRDIEIGLPVTVEMDWFILGKLNILLTFLYDYRLSSKPYCNTERISKLIASLENGRYDPVCGHYCHVLTSIPAFGKI